MPGASGHVRFRSSRGAELRTIGSCARARSDGAPSAGPRARRTELAAWVQEPGGSLASWVPARLGSRCARGGGHRLGQRGGGWIKPGAPCRAERPFLPQTPRPWPFVYGQCHAEAHVGPCVSGLPVRQMVGNSPYAPHFSVLLFQGVSVDTRPGVGSPRQGSSVPGPRALAGFPGACSSQARAGSACSSAPGWPRHPQPGPSPSGDRSVAPPGVTLKP